MFAKKSSIWKPWVKKSLKTSRSQRAAQKAEKNNEAYVLLSLKTTTQLELETNSLRSTLYDEVTELPELVLSDGIIVDLLIVNKILISHKYGEKQLHVKFIISIVPTAGFFLVSLHKS